jgi:hypothetical protein
MRDTNSTAELGTITGPTNHLTNHIDPIELASSARGDEPATFARGQSKLGDPRADGSVRLGIGGADALTQWLVHVGSLCAVTVVDADRSRPRGDQGPTDPSAARSAAATGATHERSTPRPPARAERRNFGATGRAR